MKEVVINKNKIEIYDSIEDLPIVRFSKYNKYLLIDSAIGSDIDSINVRINKAIAYTKTNISNAVKELQNLMQCINFIENEINPKHYAFAVLVKSINGEETEITDLGIKKTLEKLSEITQKQLLKQMKEAKKKIESELIAFRFQKQSSESKEFYNKIKRRLLLILDEIENDNDNSLEIDAITQELITFSDTVSFFGNENAEVEHEKRFEDNCLVITKEFGTDAKKMTVLEFYNAVENLNKIAKEIKKSGKQSR